MVLAISPQVRHQYTANALLAALPVAGVICQHRALEAPHFGALSAAQAARYAQHVSERQTTETRMLAPEGGHLRATGATEVLELECDTLADERVERFIRAIQPTVLITLGCSPVSQSLRRRVTYALNLHLGMTPRYRGADGLFWPIYNMDPERLGVSTLVVDDDIDAGAIAHHSRPTLAPHDSLHEMACKAIMVGTEDLVRIVQRISEAAPLITSAPRGSGRVHYAAAFHPRHLAVIDTVTRSHFVQDYLDQKKERDAQVTRVRYPGLD